MTNFPHVLLHIERSFMNGACIFCGQTRLFEPETIDKAYTNDYAVAAAKYADVDFCDHLASCLCDCLEGIEYAYKFASRQNAEEDLSYLMEDNEDAVPTALSAADLIFEGKVDSVTFKYGKTTLKLLKGNKTLKIDKTVTTKESLES